MEAWSPIAIVTLALTSHVYKKTLTDSPLREYSVAALAYHLSSKDKHVPADDHLKQMWKYSTKVAVKSFARLVIRPPNFHNYRVLILQVRHVTTKQGPLKAIIRLYPNDNILSHDFFYG
jgi:hypothetical protein